MRSSRKARRRHLPPQFLAPLLPCNQSLRRCPVSREDASHRILIMRVGAFGDILMGTPLLAALRDAYPDAHLTWLVEHSQAQAINANPFIDEYIQWDGDYWTKMIKRRFYPLWLVRALRLQQSLRTRHYDIFISFQPEEWPLLLRGVHAPLTVGVFDTFRRFYRATETSRNTRFYTYAYAHPLPNHRIDQYLLTLKALGLPSEVSRQMSIGYTEDDQAHTRQFLSAHGVSAQDRLVVLTPFTTWPTKCWPAECYAELGDALARWSGCRIVIIGSGEEREALQALAAQMQRRPIVAAGDLTFRQMAALVNRAELLVSGDTGPMHVATALQTPQVAIFGSTGPQWYGPKTGTFRSLLHPVPCGPCDQKFCTQTGENVLRCLQLITVEEVLDAALSLLKTRPAIPMESTSEAHSDC